MNPVHLHLLLAHAPIVGTFVAAVVLAWGLLRRSRDVRRLGLGLLALCGAATPVVYLAGDEAAEHVEHLPWASRQLIEAHEERAEAAMGAMVATGVLALGALGLSRRGRPVRSTSAGVVLAAATVGFGLLAWTGLAGGFVRHDELRPSSPAPLSPPVGRGALPRGREEER